MISGVPVSYVEQVFPASFTSCRGPNLPDQTWGPTAGEVSPVNDANLRPADRLADGSLVLCGGANTPTLCLRLEPGSSYWVHYATISSRSVSSCQNSDQLITAGVVPGLLTQAGLHPQETSY